MIRKPIVAGQFYTSSPENLKEEISRLETKEGSKISAKGIIIPHAGYIYSGKVAVSTVSRVKPKKRIIILGPNHTGIGYTFSVFPEGEWEMPFASIKIDTKLAKKIIGDAGLIKKDYSAHLHEHSIEVELPILQYFFGNFEFVPMVCGVAEIKIYQEVARLIYEAVKDISDEILIVASSDMTHYEEDSATRKKDSIAIESILKLDEEELVERVEKHNISMCGIVPVSILLRCCKLLKANKAEVILYQTSGDASGDYSSVVGYLGAVIH